MDNKETTIAKAKQVIKTKIEQGITGFPEILRCMNEANIKLDYNEVLQLLNKELKS